MSSRKLGSMPISLRGVPSAGGPGTLVAVGERLELLTLSPSSGRLLHVPMGAPPALYVAPLRLAEASPSQSQR